MQIRFIDNEGGGFADYIDVPEGKKVEEFFNERFPSRNAADFLIRVNRQPVARDYVLQPNDRVTVTPLKVDGASV